MSDLPVSDPPQTLADFLLARIAEDESAARLSMSQAPWLVVDDAAVVMRQGTTSTVVIRDGSAQRRDLQHVARHHPARVLAECEAKRRIVELHEVDLKPEVHRDVISWDWQKHTDDDRRRLQEPTGRTLYYCSGCSHDDRDYGPSYALGHGCPTLLALTSVFADHPDYRDEWRP